MNTRRNAPTGFTLIELLVVVVTLGIIATLALPMYNAMVRRARYAEAKQQMGAMARELKVYYVEQSGYPPDVSRNVKPQGVENWPAKIPYNSYYDYDHWSVGQNQCYVQIGYAGESRTRAYAVHTLNAPPPGFQEIGDNLVLGVALYHCGAGGRGPIR